MIISFTAEYYKLQRKLENTLGVCVTLENYKKERGFKRGVLCLCVHQ